MYIYSIWESSGNHHESEFEDRYITHDKKFTKDEFRQHVEECRGNDRYIWIDDLIKNMKEKYGYKDLKAIWDYNLRTGEIDE
jgi:hypothetical protein